jgi:hypothetical protein
MHNLNLVVEIASELCLNSMFGNHIHFRDYMIWYKFYQLRTSGILQLKRPTRNAHRLYYACPPFIKSFGISLNQLNHLLTGSRIENQSATNYSANAANRDWYLVSASAQILKSEPSQRPTSQAFYIIRIDSIRGEATRIFASVHR